MKYDDLPSKFVPQEITFIKQWRGNKQGTTVTLTTERQLNSAKKLYDDGYITFADPSNEAETPKKKKTASKAAAKKRAKAKAEEEAKVYDEKNAAALNPPADAEVPEPPADAPPADAPPADAPPADGE